MKAVLRAIFATLYAIAGVLHLAYPAPFVAITPSWVGWPETVVMVTGVAEIAGAVGLWQSQSSRLRQMSGAALALYALCVWPANFNHFAMDMARPDHGLGLWYHAPRLMFQPVLIGLALWLGEVRAPWSRGQD